MKQWNAKILVIVPAFNEAGQIKQVIKDIQTHAPYADIAVVNDGSTDNTLAQIKQSDVIVLNLPYNLGIGGAVQTGYQYALDQHYDVAIQIDGDGQHDPAELDKLLEAFFRSGADMLIGSRFLNKTGYQSTYMRRMGIRLLSIMVSGLTRRQASDTTSGYRLCGRRAISLFAEQYPTDYPEVESLILMHNHGLQFVEEAVSMRPRTFGKSSITALKSVYYMMKVILAIMIVHFQKVRQEQM